MGGNNLEYADSWGTAGPIIDYTKIGASQGWQCPQCQKIYSPWQYECLYCNNQKPETKVACTDNWEND